MIPKYIEDIASIISSGNDKTTVQLQCTCGNNHFYLKSNNEKNINQNLEKEFVTRFGKGFEAHSNDNGEVEFIKRNFLGKIIDRESSKKYLPFSARVIFFAECIECHKKYTIFDNMHNGYNSIEFDRINEEQEMKIGSFTVKDYTKEKKSRVYITFRNEGITDSNLRSLKSPNSREDIANLFSQITIYLSSDGISKKRKIYQEETR